MAKKRIRRYFATGMVVLAPVALTAFALVWVFNTLDEILGKPLRLALGMDIPGLGFLLLSLFVVLVGWVVHQAAGRQLLSLWNTALVKFPLTGRIYNTVSQIIQAVFGGQQEMFHRAVLVPYPTDDTWAIAFVTNEEPTAISQAVGVKCINVFLPTTPNPTSGFFLAVPADKAIRLAITVEDATKLVISAGALLPGGLRGNARGLDVEKLLWNTRDQEIKDLSTPKDGNG